MSTDLYTARQQGRIDAQRRLPKRCPWCYHALRAAYAEGYAEGEAFTREIDRRVAAQRRADE